MKHSSTTIYIIKYIKATSEFTKLVNLTDKLSKVA